MKTIINIKTTIRILVLLLAFSFVDVEANMTNQKEIFSAMRDEMNRSLNSLQIENLNKPYFIEYIVRFTKPSGVRASMGALLSSSTKESATLTVRVRVGSYTFDNTNYLNIGSFFFGSGDDEERFMNRNIPLNLDYESLRRELWLATDAAYKGAVEDLSKKKSTIKNKVIKDTSADFSMMKPVKFVDTIVWEKIDLVKYENLCKEISAKFANTKIFQGDASFEYTPERVYYMNSEGTEYIRDEVMCGIEFAAFSQSKDGTPIFDSYATYAFDTKHLPSKDSLLRANEHVINNLTKIATIEPLEDSYSGPVLFTAQAAGEIFSQVFLPNLATKRTPISDMGSQGDDRFSAFQNKVGGRVLPEFMSVKIAPEMAKYQNIQLVGTYKYDEEGVKAKQLDIIKDGYLKTLLSSRIPTKRIKESNGHYRKGGIALSNVIIEANKSHAKSYKDLKNKMISLCKDRELPYGIVIKKMANPNIFMTQIYSIAYGLIEPRFNQMMPILEAYKVFPDGREELITGAELGKMSSQSFKDIILCGKDAYVHNLLMMPESSGGLSYSSRYATVSVAVPDLLFEDAEIKQNDADIPKLPIINMP